MRLYIYLILGFLVLLVIGAATYYYKSSQEEMKILREQLAVAQLKIDIQDKQMENLKNRIEQQKKATEEFNDSVDKIREKADEIIKDFSNKDINKDIKENPLKIENDMNKVYKDIFDDLEKISRG